jgi:hypothetical protein
VRLAGLIGRGEVLKSWFESPGWFDATPRAAVGRMAAAEATAPWKVAEREASTAMHSKLCALINGFFDGEVRHSEIDVP